MSLVILSIAVAACRNRPPDDRNYETGIAAARAAKDVAFKNSSDPVPPSRHAELLPLAYFPIEPSYKVPASLKPTTDRAIITLPSTGGQRRMRKVGTLEFLLKGQPLQLSAFLEIGGSNADRLFVAFTDMTSGTETYPGGRYLDLDRNATGIYEIDFNRAYHPYCYYDPTYDCPYPPPENRLKVPIRAGERLKTARRAQSEVGSKR